MTEVVLFHHVQGLTPGVVAFADELRAAGHTVHTPDVFDGNTFATVEDGIGYVKSVGFGEMIERGVRAAEGGCPSSWCTPASRSASWPRRNWRRPAQARAAHCCWSPASRQRSSG